MNAVVDPTPPGKGSVWRRRLGYAPLAILLIASVVALGAGATADRSGAEHEVPTPATPSTDPAAAVCRPPVVPPTQEPWLAGDGSAETTWQQNAAEVSREYLIGPQGWIFWSDYIDSYASQAVGRTTLSTDQVDQWVSYYSSLRDGLAAQGIEFSIVVTPSTSSIYPEQLPTWMAGLRGSTIMDQFMARAGDLPVIDLRRDLIDAKTSDVNLYSWSNSHWTDYGGYVGWQQIAACVNATNGTDELRVPPISGYEVVGDFNEWASFGVQSPGADWAVPVFTDPLAAVTVTDSAGVATTVPGETPIDLSQLPVTTAVDASWTGKSALILRDSMGGALSPYWDQAYSPTWQIKHQYTSFADFPDYRGLVAQYQPDVVILQLAERYLLNPPPPGASY